MHKITLFFFFLLVTLQSVFTQNNLPYPVIFVHGLTGSDESFGTTMEYFRDHDNLGTINVFDVVLNADNDTESSLMSSDVRWNDFYYSGDYINVGRRNYKSDIDDFTDGWTGSNIFAINFKEERIRGAAGFWNDYFDQSNESGIFKQGYALGKMIQEVLAYTGAEKVILVGHSMGGLCIREYLQRTNSSGTHVNWIDPTIAGGHKVARVATYGTPHLGSNTSPDPTKSNQTKSDIPSPTGNSEANRDLLWEYDSYNYCSGTPKGIYMFGGNEHCIESEDGWFGNETFDNVDINCDGDQNDDIVGINESYYSYNYNPAMPLPLDIKYTYMTSIWADWGGNLVGDGAVNINRQWLHNGNTPTPVGLADTTLSDILHTSEGADYEYIIRGIDEPERFDLAYKLQFNKPIIGYISYQQGHGLTDIDVFKVNCTGHNAIAITLDEALSGVHTIGFYDASETMLCSRTVSSFPEKLYVNVPEGESEIYIKISGTATNNTWQNPYTLTVLSGSWEGNISSDWNNASNWIIGTPDLNDDVYISEEAGFMPIVNTHVDCNRANIPETSTITINETASVNFHNDMILNGQIILKSDFINTASYLDNGTISGNGTVLLERNLQSGGYHYLASHVSDGSSVAFTELDNGYTNPNFYTYNETNDNPDWLYGWVQTGGIMQAGSGYAYYGPGEQTMFESNGNPNTGNISVPVKNSGYGISSDGWNLIGNPYPSAISAFDFINLNSSGFITGAIYLWDDDYSDYFVWEDYGVYNLSGFVSGTGGGKSFNGYIAPGQGFFVKAVNSGNVNFQNSIRSINNSAFFRSQINDDIKRLYINLAGNDIDNNILLAFTDEASDGFDILYDAERNKVNPDFAFYSILGDKDLIIQAFPENYDESFEIKLGADIGTAGNYTFTYKGIESLPQDVEIFLKDKLLNSHTDLRTQENYTVNMNAGIYKDRFSIVFNNASADINNTDLQNNMVYAIGNKLYYNLPYTEIYDTYIYNAEGKMIAHHKITGGTSEYELTGLSSGIYFVNIISRNSVITKKVFVNKD